jgi:hypothetical protein
MTPEKAMFLDIMQALQSLAAAIGNIGADLSGKDKGNHLADAAERISSLRTAISKLS